MGALRARHIVRQRSHTPHRIRPEMSCIMARSPPAVAIRRAPADDVTQAIRIRSLIADQELNSSVAPSASPACTPSSAPVILSAREMSARVVAHQASVSCLIFPASSCA